MAERHNGEFIRVDMCNIEKNMAIVEFAAKYKPGFRNKFIPIEELRAIASYFRDYDVYTSIFLYPEELLSQANEKFSVADYEGYVLSHYLFFDIDNKDVRTSQIVAQKLLSFLYEYWQVCKEGVSIAFSGKKGFHIGVQSSLFGEILPATDLNLTFDKLRRELAACSGLENENSIDYSIGDRSRLWRLLNTIHGSSGLYKVQLSASEIFSMNVDQIKQIDRKPRPPINTDATGLIPIEYAGPNDEAVDFYQNVVTKTQQKKNIEKIPVINRLPVTSKAGKSFCQARNKIFNSRIPEGIRNKCLIRLASSLRVAGYEKDASIMLLLDWNLKNNIGLPEKEIISPVKSSYNSSEPYTFGCDDQILKQYCVMVQGKYKKRAI